jgi:hypothetical protein
VIAGPDGGSAELRQDLKHCQNVAASSERKAPRSDGGTELDCDSDGTKMRLEFADEALVQMPHAGWKFAG